MIQGLNGFLWLAVPGTDFFLTIYSVIFEVMVTESFVIVDW